MKIMTRIIVLILLVVSGGMLVAQKSYDFEKDIAKYRKKEAKKFKSPAKSPIKDADARKHFEGVEYFEPNKSYRVVADVVLAEGAEPFEVPTSAGRKKQLVLWAVLEFELNGEKLQLESYRNVSIMNMPAYRDYLFIPFKDATCGKETYGGGRYIETTIPKSGNTIVIDFNKAFNPYCAYSDGWNCTLVPEANWLEVEIRAGARGWLDH